MVVVAVNWDDTNAVDINLDLVVLGIATNKDNNCVNTDLYTGVKSTSNGGIQTFKNIN